MADRKPKRIPIGIALAGAAVLAVLGTWCATYSDPASNPPSTLGPSENAATTGSEHAMHAIAAPPPATEDAGARVVAGPNADAGTAPPENSVARMMRATDAHDRVLLSDIERQTKRAPSAAVHELLALRRAGKSREELQQHIEHAFQGQALERMLATRWLRAISGDAAPKPVPFKLHTSDEQTGPRRVQKLVPKTPVPTTP